MMADRSFDRDNRRPKRSDMHRGMAFDRASISKLIVAIRADSVSDGTALDRVAAGSSMIRHGPRWHPDKPAVPTLAGAIAGQHVGAGRADGADHACADHREIVHVLVDA